MRTTSDRSRLTSSLIAIAVLGGAELPRRRRRERGSLGAQQLGAASSSSSTEAAPSVTTGRARPSSALRRSFRRRGQAGGGSPAKSGAPRPRRPPSNTVRSPPRTPLRRRPHGGGGIIERMPASALPRAVRGFCSAARSGSPCTGSSGRTSRRPASASRATPGSTTPMPETRIGDVRQRPDLDRYSPQGRARPAS